MRTILLVAFLAALAAGCAPNMNIDMEARLVQNFHTDLNGANYGHIYDSADPAFMGTPRTMSIRVFAAIHRKLGNELSSKNATVELQRKSQRKLCYARL